MGDLGERRLETLAVGMQADPQFESAVRRHSRAGLLAARHHRDAPAGIDGCAVRGLLAIDREPQPDPASVRLAVLLPGADRIGVDRLQGARQRLRIVAAVEVLVGDVVERHLLGPDKIFAAAPFRRPSPAARSDRVERQLEREAHAGPGDAAIGQDRAFVGRDRPGAAAIGRKIVGTRQNAGHLRRFQTSGERIGRIGAGIDDRLAVDAAQPPVALGIERDLVMVLAAVGVGGQVLASILEPANRMTAAKREPAEADFFGEQDPLVAEAAADVGRDDADAALLQAKTFGKAGANDMRHLARRVEHELIAAMVEHGDAAPPLDRRHALSRGRDRTGDLDRRVESSRRFRCRPPSRGRRCRPNARARGRSPARAPSSMSTDGGQAPRGRARRSRRYPRLRRASGRRTWR